ncbi:MAG TPA: DinB family protein [Chitinophagaceae bacterium]|jgi:uncharacterized damage-inducible protein DinB|nr:DinB family protein [Chitinophagaceae bacterium]
MLIQTLKLLFDRDLKRLRAEIDMYNNEQALWHIEKNIANSAGNLCLHLVGNLNTYIGATIGKTNYIRNREQEFSLKGIPKTELLKQIDQTIIVVNSSLDNLTEDDLAKEYPILVFSEKTTTEYLLIHLTTHLTYHLGQINYHRRLLDN